MKVKSKKLRDSARNQDCTLRLIRTCNFNPETTILCHVGSMAGMGTKSGDNMAVFGCSACHAVIDGTNSQGAVDNPNIHEDILRALQETQQIWIDKGLVVIK